MKFVKIKAGTFNRDNYPVTITKDFEMLATQVTQRMWANVMNSNPSHFKNPNHPVESVSWNDCQGFIAKLNKMKDGYVYRLPTEAEWEYAAGKDVKEECLKEYAWYAANADRTHTVAGLRPNANGLYDMIGNVWEWCQDWYGAYPKEAVTDPTGPSSGSYRVVRGGSWGSPAPDLRSAGRYGHDPGIRDFDLGFRLVRTLDTSALLRSKKRKLPEWF